MIVVDTSALMAILLEEELGRSCIEAIVLADRISISAGTFAEAMIVAQRRTLADEMRRVIVEGEFEVATVDEEAAARAADAYRLWGKGFHPARLNYGDCFAYELARRLDCPLLYIGSDFSQTDIAAAI